MKTSLLKTGMLSYLFVIKYPKVLPIGKKLFFASHLPFCRRRAWVDSAKRNPAGLMLGKKKTSGN
jgi:hypothetical protein